jgi:hypothetical protein
MLRISNASVHIIPHGSMSHALMFALEVCRYVRSILTSIFPSLFVNWAQPTLVLCRGRLP